MATRCKRLIPVVLYSIIYLLCFTYLEHLPVKYHIINSDLDSMIPFCEYFIVPYFLWFIYIAGAVVFFLFFNDNEYEYRTLIINLGIGMTLFLIVSCIYPNGLSIRPQVFPRENIFTDLVRFLYRIDTPTNVLPSIHVYNSVAVFCSIGSCRKLQKHRVCRGFFFILTVLIVLSTMFLKQHSILDVTLGITLSLATYIILNHIYFGVTVKEKRRSRSHSYN